MEIHMRLFVFTFKEGVRFEKRLFLYLRFDAGICFLLLSSFMLHHIAYPAQTPGFDYYA
jgi:hypothetical protein